MYQREAPSTLETNTYKEYSHVMTPGSDLDSGSRFACLTRYRESRRGVVSRIPEGPMRFGLYPSIEKCQLFGAASHFLADGEHIGNLFKERQFQISPKSE